MNSYSLIEQYINENGDFVATPVGTSMWPMLRNRRDNVYLVKKTEKPLEKYDLPVYKRADGSLVMHRVLELEGERTYTMCGDNQCVKEYGVTHEQVIAVMMGFYRDNKYIPRENKVYKMYVRFWCKSLSARRIMLKVMHGFCRIFGRKIK